jgi:hypothetical protein
MWKYVAVALTAATVSVFTYSYARPQLTSPGLEPFTPTRIDWLVTDLQAALREDSYDRYGYVLDITNSDPETIVILVGYRPNVNQREMKGSIDSAKIIINQTTKRYGWDNWIKIREDVQPLPVK